jgi:hypothetical protein
MNYCARYLTSVDLSSAYLQIELHEYSRKYTVFLFDSTVYQFKRVLYGFRNLLPAFIRALKLALAGNTIENVVLYIDDILVHSKTFEGHLKPNLSARDDEKDLLVMFVYRLLLIRTYLNNKFG